MATSRTAENSCSSTGTKGRTFGSTTPATRWNTSLSCGRDPSISRPSLKEKTKCWAMTEKATWKGLLPMRNDVNVKVNLEAEDTLAVRLKSLEVKADWTEGSVRETLERQTRAILDKASLLEGGLALIEVDGASN